MINIDKSTPNLVCIQIYTNEEKNFVEKLRNALESNERIRFETNAGILIINPSAIDCLIDCSKENIVLINLRKEDSLELIEAIEEHITDSIGLPLDHSFEALGAKMIPPSLEDVIIETI